MAGKDAAHGKTMAQDDWRMPAASAQQCYMASGLIVNMSNFLPEVYLELLFHHAGAIPHILCHDHCLLGFHHGFIGRLHVVRAVEHIAELSVPCQVVQLALDLCSSLQFACQDMSQDLESDSQNFTVRS